MMKFKPLVSRNIKTYPLRKRKSKVNVNDLAKPLAKGGSFGDFLKTLPGILAARDLRAVIAAVIRAHKTKKTVSLGMGAHVIKAGLSPLIVDLMERGIVNAVSMNGAGIIHDFELSFAGRTSEDVDSGIGSGKFGMAEETGRLLNDAILRGAKKGFGIGRSVGGMIGRSGFPYKNLSITAAGVRCDVPVTVHVALGTDIIHLHPRMDGSSTGRASQKDFEKFASVVSTLEGGVFINIGSAVIIPEVFLKALTLARNLGYKVKNFTTVNMDFIQHYRPGVNVVRRPTLGGGKGYALTGHHEIMVPLLYAGIIEGI
ncbi:MAG: deoxyhypusine synthase family protein [Deltaproteobacteria bacterium]|nr:deoxyhypusine synthase family protein [Deltaproteobacteria bacterium]